MSPQRRVLEQSRWGHAIAGDERGIAGDETGDSDGDFGGSVGTKVIFESATC